MRILLDENLPLALHRELAREGIESEHLVLGRTRGVSDARILERLDRESLVFVTQDTDFLVGRRSTASVVLVSRIPQSWPLRSRLTAWMDGIREFQRSKPSGRVFEIVEAGTLMPVP